MAQLEFNIKANFDQIKQAKQELERLRGELLKTTKATDKAVVQDLTDKYAEQKQKVTELSSAMSRYALVMSSDYAKKMQNLTREVYSFELQTDASKRKIERLSSEIAKMQSKLRKGGLDIGTSTILNRDISENSTILNEEKRRYENLTGLGKHARTELQNMQAEYVRYSGSSNATTDNVKVMTDAFAGMIEEMKKVPTVGEGATSLFNRLGGDAKQLAMSLVGGLGFEQLAEHIFNVRSQFQQLEISFTTMLGSEQRAGALMNQLVQTAAKTPFDMSSITNGAKQLLAYGTAANEVNDILVHLGDISAGLSVPLNDLVYLYGTTMSQGRMYTMDLRQFMGRGIPMAEELGKIMGKTTQEVQQAVTDGKVGADLVKKAIINMTEEGGKFGGLMEKQSTTLQGKWSNIGDSVDQMFNELGKKSQGIFGTGLDLISSLVDNWETLVKTIGSAAVMVGTYKAGLMAAASIQKAQNKATLDSIASNLDEKIKAYKDEAELYHSYTGKDTSEYKSQRLSDLNKAVSNTDMLGTDKAEELVSLKIKEAQTDGLITQQMAEQLQLKRDMLVTQQQSAAKEQMEALELSKGLDEKMAQFKEMENDYRHLNGKDTKDYKASRYNELGNALSDTENIGDDETEKRISKQIELAKSEGLISDEMAKQLQLKRDLLVEQTRLAEKEQLQWQNAVNAKEAAEEELRAKKSQEADIAAANKAAEQAKAEADLKQKIAKANETAYGKALLETNALQKKVDLQQESYDKAMDEAREKRVVLAQLDEEIKKQQQIIEQKEKELVYDNGAVDTTSFGGYADSFSDNENSSIVQYEAEQAKLEELMQKRQQADEEYESSNAKRKAIQQELQTTTEKLTEAEENETEVYKETGAAADEIGDIVQQGIDIEDGKISITEAATTATQTNTTSEASNATAKGANANATSSETIANTANSTSKTANTAATNVNTTSENVNTGAKERNSLVTSILSVGTKGLALAQNVLTWATNAVTVSMRELWAAMLSNPLTSILTLVTTAMSVFAMFGSSEEDVAKKTQDMGNKAAEASNKVRALFSTLVQASGKEADHKDVINELKSAYEQYGIQLDETKMKSQNAADQTDELLKHENELIGVIEKRAIEMERANQLQAAYDNYNSSNDETYSSFKKDSGLSDAEAGQVRNLISQDDLDKMAQLKQEMSECAGQQEVWNALNAQYKKMQTQLNAELVTYLLIQGKHKDEITDILGYFKDYTNGVVDNTIELNKNKAEVNNSANAAEKAKKAVSGLTYAQEEQALKNQYAKKSFKDLNSEIQETIKLCSRKLHLDIKVNYDDSELPAWIKNMSQSQLKASMAARKNWLDGHKKGDVLQVGGQYKTYEQVANELAMMQARGNNFESKPKKSQKEIDKERKAREKAARDAEKARNDAETKAGNKRKAEEDYSKSISSYSEKASDELSKRRTELIKNETEKEIAQINMSSDKEKKAIEDSIDKLVEAKKKKDQTVWVNSGKGRKANMWKQGKSDAEYRKEVLGTQMVDDKGNHLGKTIGQNSEDQIALIEKQRQLKLKEIQQAEIKDMLDFMKQYGSLEQQRYAILKEYTDKIDLAREKGDTFGAASAEMEMNDQLKKLNFTDFKDSINWDVVFQDMNRLSIPYLEDLRKKMKELLGSGTLEIDDMKTVSDQIYKIDDAISQQKDRWGLVNDAVREHRRLIDEAKDAQDRLAQARKGEFDAKADNMSQRRKIQGVFAESGVNIDTSNITSANKDKLMGSTKNLSASQTEKLRKLFDDLAVSEVKVGKATKEVGKAQEEAKVKQDAAKKSLHDTIEEWAEGLRKIQDKLKDLPGLVDALGLGNTGFGKAVNNGMDALNSGIQAFSDFASGNYIGAAMNGIKTIGSLGKMFGIGGGNGAEVAKKTEELTESNDRLMYSIDKLKESIDKSSGYTAVSNYNAAYDAQKQVNTQTMDILKTQMGYHGAHHSNAYYWNLSAQDYAAINKTLAQQSAVRGGYTNSSINKVNSLEDIYKLTPEQMADIRTHNADVWKNMTDQGKYDKTEYWEQYTELAGKLEELTEQINENLTQTTFDSMKSDFINNLMDMSKSAKDFSNDFTTMLNQSMLNFALGDLMNKKLKPLYESWANKMKENGGRQLTPTELNNLKEEYDKIVQEGLAIRDNIADITGYKQSYEQSASSGSFESMSQDTGNELNGRFTAVQIATEGTYEEAKLINTKLDAIAAREGGIEGSLLTASVNTIMGDVGNIWTAVDEGRTILAQSLMCLQSIDERQESWNKHILQMSRNLDTIKNKVDRL
jgi:tape measure domain-containing protein